MRSSGRGYTMHTPDVPQLIRKFTTDCPKCHLGSIAIRSILLNGISWDRSILSSRWTAHKAIVLANASSLLSTNGCMTFSIFALFMANTTTA